TGTISAVRGDKTLQFIEGSNSVLINGNEIQIKQAPIVKDGTTYVSIRFIAETLGLDVDWNDEENSILIRTPEYMKKEAEKEQPEKKRKLLYAIEFDNDGDMEGGRIGGDYSSAKVEGGAFKGTVAGGDPIFYTPDGLDIPAEEIKNISIGVKNSTTGTAMDIFFITNNSGSYAEDKVIYTNVKPQTDDVVKYNINPKKSSMWKDKIRQIRFDVTNKNGNVEIDYIRLEGDTEEEVGNNNNLNVKSMLRDDNQVTWNFNLNTLIDGWIPNKYMGNVVAENGELYATLGGNNAAILTNSELNIPMSSIEKIVVKYQNITNSNKAKMFFTTNKKENFSDEKSVTFETVSNDSISTRYEIELKNNENSYEILNSLKFEPGYGQGSFKIDYIKIILK
ncbi:MAG: copper amine oxidase N-terminal domain-containing protein, partial [Oscillospiraceae bacterium]